MWFSYPAPEGPVVADLNLGWDKRKDNANEEYYVLGGGQGYHHYSRTGSEQVHQRGNEQGLAAWHGDCSLNERFQNVLREAVEGCVAQQS